MASRTLVKNDVLVCANVQLIFIYVCHEHSQRSDADVAMHTFHGDTAHVVVHTKLGMLILRSRNNSELVKHVNAIERPFVLQ